LRRWLSREVKKGNIQLIEVPDYLGLLPFRVRGCPTVVRLHLSLTAIHLMAQLRRPRAITFYERRTLGVNPFWIGVSQYILDSTKELFRVSPRRAVKIYSPVPSAPEVLPNAPDIPGKFILYAGHVTKRKGALILAEAAKPLLKERSDLHLVYVGGELEEPGAPPIRYRVQQILGQELATRVHFIGRVDREKVLSYMKAATVFAFPSKLEALGLVILEAMNCGVPVVFAANPPGPEIVEDGVTGLLADPDSPLDFSQKIARILNDPKLARELAKNAMVSIVQRFSLDRFIRETEDFYKHCLGDNPDTNP
jgi:glycosyltransferase involved in cell wall biosynthesis